MPNMGEAPSPLSDPNAEYYRRARVWYSDLHHTPIAERSYFLVVIGLTVLNVWFAIASFSSMFPLRPVVPFVTYSDDVFEDLPQITRIAQGNEDKNVAVMNFLVKSFVENYESYDLPRYEFRYRSIWSQSDPAVFARYRALADAANPYSAYRLYTTRAKRTVNVLSVESARGEDLSRARVIFIAPITTLADSREVSRSKWEADIVYRYTDFVVDQSLDKHVWLANLFGLTGGTLKASGEKRNIVPMTFKVTDYQVKELLE